MILKIFPLPKNHLHQEQDENLRRDIQSVLGYRNWIKAKTQRTFDTSRILGVVAAAAGAENYLPYTIPKVIKQISEIGLGGDIIIGLNNGYECQTVIEEFNKLSQVQVIHLYTREKASSTTPAEIFENVKCEGEPYRLSNLTLQPNQHRIFVVHQKEGIYAAGKIRMLGDIYGSLILKSIEQGWIPPAITVAFDAESLFLVNQEGRSLDLESNGLRLIVHELQNHPEIELLGANNRFVVYQKQWVDTTEIFLPDFDEELSPIHFFLNFIHGQYRGYNYKPASCTVGRTDVIISLFYVIAETYPGARVDDLHLSILAENAGFSGDIFMNAVSTNRVPNIFDKISHEPLKLAWIEQVHRWLTGIYALESCYGKFRVGSVSSPRFSWNVLIDPRRFIKRYKEIEKSNLLSIIKRWDSLLMGLFIYIKLRKKAIKTPDILQGSRAKASW